MNSLLEALRPSVVTALIRLRRRMREDQTLSIGDAHRLLLATYDNAGFDFETAIELHGRLADIPLETALVFQAVISLAVEEESPTWSILIRRGRESLANLDPDTVACFDRAGAFQDEPTPETLKWWDSLAALAYSDRDAERCVIGRKAERLSFEYEKVRLKSEASAPDPIWKALDDNMIGYDIQSWNAEGSFFEPKLIEVKGSTLNPPIIFLSRNEWDTAVRHPHSYVFQVWSLGSGVMHELSVPTMRSSIPVDAGSGRWQEVRIELSRLDWTSGRAPVSGAEPVRG